MVALTGLTIQALCSSGAGVYNQWLIKRSDDASRTRDEANKLGLWEKNIFMYFWGLVFNLLSCLYFKPGLLSHFMRTFDNPAVIPIICCAALMGERKACAIALSFAFVWRRVDYLVSAARCKRSSQGICKFH